jgi:hypothetical protein
MGKGNPAWTQFGKLKAIKTIDTLDRSDPLQVPLLDLFRLYSTFTSSRRSEVIAGNRLARVSNSLAVSSRTEVVAASKTSRQGDSIPFMRSSSEPSTNSLAVSSEFR